MKNVSIHFSSFLPLILLCHLIIIHPKENKADSLQIDRNWWHRYAKTPIQHREDTSFQQWLCRRDEKRIRFNYDVDFYTYFDNREYDSPYQTPQTFFNFQLSPSIGLIAHDNIGGFHKLMTGLRFTYPLGGHWNETILKPTAYYQYAYHGFNLSMGSIPYENRISPLPHWIMYDSLAYVYSNIQGALFSYNDPRGYVSLMCDWRGSRAEERREMFSVVLDGEYRYKWFRIGGIGRLNHTALSFNHQDEESLFDDINLSVNIGVDFSHKTVFDSLTFRLSYIYGYNRNRKDNISYHPQGLLAEVILQWWFLGLQNTLYYGDNLQPHRPTIGSLMCLGDPFYQSTFYDRLDLFFYLYRSRYMSFFFSWNLHWDDTYRLQHQQQLCIRFNLERLFSRTPPSSYLPVFSK